MASWHLNVSERLVNIELGDGLLPDGTNSSPTPLMAYHQGELCHSPQDDVYLYAQDINHQIMFKMYTIETTTTSPGDNELNCCISYNAGKKYHCRFFGQL